MNITTIISHLEGLNDYKANAAAVMLQNYKDLLKQLLMLGYSVDMSADTTQAWREAIPKMAPPMVEHAGFPSVEGAECCLWLFILMCQGKVEGFTEVQVARGTILLRKYYTASCLLGVIKNEPFKYLPQNVVFDDQLLTKAYTGLRLFYTRFDGHLDH